jgi:O-antigen/teichoic acid export membrane protein
MSLRTLVERLRGRGFAKHVSFLVAGSVAGQLVAVLLSPLVTRLYTPAEYGILGVYMSTLAIVSMVAMLRYEAAVPGCQDHTLAMNVAALAATVAVGISVASGLVLWGVVHVAPHAFGLGLLGPYILLLPFGILGTSLYQLLSMWAIRQHDYDALARTKLSQNVGMMGTQLALGVARAGAGGLIIGHIIGQSGGIGTLLRRMWKRDRTLVHGVSRVEMWRAAQQYRRFPLLSGTASLLDAIVGYGPIIVLAAMYDANVAGWVTLVQRVVALPFTLLATSIGQVFFGEVARLVDAPKVVIRQLLVRRIKQTILLGLPITLILALLAPVVIPLVFGNRWGQAGLCIQLMSPMLLVSFVSNPFGSILDVLERQDLHLIRSVLRTVVLTIAFLIAYYAHVTWSIAVALVSAAGVLNGILYLGATWSVVRGDDPSAGASSVPAPTLGLR